MRSSQHSSSRGYVVGCEAERQAGSRGLRAVFLRGGGLPAGNLAEGVWLAKFGVWLFSLGLMGLMVGVMLLGAAMLRAKVLPAWSAWPLIVGWPAFLPVANSHSIFGFPHFASSLLAAGTMGVGWVAIGFALAVRRGEPPAAPARHKRARFPIR